MNRRHFFTTTSGALLSAATLAAARRLCAAPAATATNSGEILVPVKRKPADAQWKNYAARTLDGLPDFAPGAPDERSVYGGFKAHQVMASGFFRAEKIGERWWLIDPDGYPFIMAGVNGVRVGKSEAAKAALDQRFGSARQWAATTTTLLRDAGFNTVGSWSDDELLRATPQPLPYCEMIDGGLMGGFGKKLGVAKQGTGHSNYPRGAMPVFHPDFAAYCDQRAQTLASLRGDAYLIGYFSDNELPTPKLENYLALDANDEAMGSTAREATDWLQQRRGNDGQDDLTKDENEAWMERVYDRYFEVTTAAIRRYDPNHLCLGARFYAGEKNSPGAFRAAGRYLDVISINHYYDWNPTAETLARWTRWSGRPIVITEWYAKGMDSGMANNSGAGWTVPTQRDRGLFYQTFALALLQAPGCVGWHWFKYIDNDPTDLTADPSNRDSNKGIVNTDFEPYQPLLELMRSLNFNLYRAREYFASRKL